MYIYIYIILNLYIHVHKWKNVHICIYIYIFISMNCKIHTYIYISIHVHVYIPIPAWDPNQETFCAEAQLILQSRTNGRFTCSHWSIELSLTALNRYRSHRIMIELKKWSLDHWIMMDAIDISNVTWDHRPPPQGLS